MNRKLDLSSLLLFTALLFGVIVRFYPAIANGFPLNDGGMFFSMVQDLKANGFRLPDFTTYNQADIPFAYPPFGFYVAALLSALVPDSDLAIFLYLPAFVNSLSIVAFYLFAKETLNSRLTASLATVIFSLTSRAFLWQVMGGGITRSFGMLFLLLMFWQAVQLFKNYQHKHLLLTILFGAGTVISHPQTALHAALGGVLLFLFFGRSQRGVISAFLVGLGVALLSVPWWGTVLARHGLETFLSAGGTSQRTLEFYLIALQLHTPLNIPAIPLLVLFYIGLWLAIRERNFFPIFWIVIAYLIDPRGADVIALLMEAMLAAMGLIQLAAWTQRTKTELADSLMMQRGSLNLLFGLFIWLILMASISDFQLVNTSVKQADLDMMGWVNENVTEDKTFVLATGREFSMTDPLQEWFPALTGQKSLTTMQGLEWTYGEKFFPWYEQLTEFQKCSDMTCVENWSARNNVNYDYLIVLIPAENETGELADSLKRLGISARGSDTHNLVFESEHAMIFETKR